MRLNISEVPTPQDRQQPTEETISRYKLYNLLFAGKISMEDYLKGLRSLEDNNRSEAYN